MRLSSDAFSDGETIPKRFTCDDENLSPPLRWSGLPDGTRALALVCDDPDAPRGTWVHWVLYSSRSDANSFEEGFSSAASGGAVREGINDFGDMGYGGPCPPPGKPHRYSFRLYALDTPLDLAAHFDKAQLMRATEGHVLAEAELTGRYGR